MSTSLAKAGGTPSAMTSCSCTAWANDSAVMPSSLHRMSRLEDSGPVNVVRIWWEEPEQIQRVVTTISTNDTLDTKVGTKQK